MKTIEFLGEENFLNICKKFSLKEEEVEIVRGIIEKWDETLKITDTQTRSSRKAEIGFEEFLKISQERRERFVGALFEVNSLFATLFRQRH